MAYMMMLVVNDMDQLKEVLKAWKSIHVDDIVYMDSTCFHRADIKRPHIPMRFRFEELLQGKQHYSITLFGIAGNEAMVHQCLAQAETIMGDLDTVKNAMFAAWPLPIVKGFVKQSNNQREGAE